MADPSPADQVTSRARAEHRTTVTIVAIDGPAGSGKTTLATVVADRLDQAPLIHMDDLFPGWDGLAAAPALLVAQVLAPIHRGEQPGYRRFDWLADQYAEHVALRGHEYLVVEGCASSVGIARPYATVRVWLDAHRDERMRRGLERDGEMFAPHWERWAAQERAIYAQDQTEQHAHLTFRTDGPEASST
ncbi:(d)CMP kinase [Demetria terragena]|uniref:(d)CMP kinase n=1 Tax=Demetria terragena TaxID=63959 RepID=UPI00037BAF7A|nr:(d)CMP kinase [Demetria terragena]